MRRLAQLALLMLVACAHSTEPSPFVPEEVVTLTGDVELTFRAERLADSVLVFADLRSVGADSGSMDAGSSSFGIRGMGAFGNVWDNRPPPGANSGGTGLSIKVGPGELGSIRVYRASAPILRQQVPAGPYDITVFIRLDGKVQSFFAGQIQL